MAAPTLGDGNFTALVDAGWIAMENPLKDCLPSSLNLTADCIAAYELANATLPSLESIGVLSERIYNGLQAAVPQEYKNASFSQFLGYWRVLLNISDTWETLRTFPDAANWCIEQNLFAIPLASIDVTRDCASAAIFWNRNKCYRGMCIKTIDMDWREAATFLRTTLDSSLQRFSDWTLALASWETMQIPEFLHALEASASRCPEHACRVLNFPGNADIAGIGAIIAYGIIAFMSLAMATSGVLHNHNKDIFGRYHIVWYNTIASFWDSMSYFTIMISVASMVYSSIFAGSIYELLMCGFAILLSAESALVLLTLGQFEQDESKVALVAYPRVFCPAFAVGAAMVLLYRYQGTFRISDDTRLSDAVCYDKSRWIITLSTVLVAVFLFQWVVFLFEYAFRSRLRKFKWSGPVFTFLDGTWFLGLTFSQAIAYLMTPTVFISMVVVRSKVSAFYGESFRDDNLGFGQIVATSFALNAIWVFIFYLWHQRSKYTQNPGPRTRPNPNAKWFESVFR